MAFSLGVGPYVRVSRASARPRRSKAQTIALPHGRLVRADVAEYSRGRGDSAQGLVRAARVARFSRRGKDVRRQGHRLALADALDKLKRSFGERGRMRLLVLRDIAWMVHNARSKSTSAHRVARCAPLRSPESLRGTAYAPASLAPASLFSRAVIVASSSDHQAVA